MSEKNSVNNFVRHKIRRMRKSKKLKIREIATLASMPHSSYASMESGFYNINLDNLFRILGALEVDIREVWPAETLASEFDDCELYLQKIQQFRLSEIISLSEAEGAALFSVQDGRCEILLYQGLSDFLMDRLILYMEDGLTYDSGVWFQRSCGDKTLHLFVKGEECPSFLGKLIKKYLALWAEVYG